MGIKDNWSRAVKQVMNKNEQEQTAYEPEENAQSDGELLETLQQYLKEDDENCNTDGLTAMVQEDDEIILEKESSPVKEKDTFSLENIVELIDEEEPAPAVMPEEKSVSIISRDAVFRGDITIKGSIEIWGELHGNLTVDKDIFIYGTVVGDIAGNNIRLSGCRVWGNINATGAVTVDKDSVLVGEVRGESIEVYGKIRGNINVTGKATFVKEALLYGDVKAGALSLDEGSRICGRILTDDVEEIMTYFDEAPAE